MSSETAALLGAIIGFLSSSLITVLLWYLKERKHSIAIEAIAAAEIVAIKEKAERFFAGISSHEELQASTPMLISIASQLGYLKPSQVIALRRAVTLDMEMKKTQNKDKIKLTIQACEEALQLFPQK